MTGRKSNEQFQIGPHAYVDVVKIPGSPCYLVRRFYLTPDSPSGAYTTGEPAYIPSDSAFGAASEYLATINGGRVEVVR